MWKIWHSQHFNFLVIMVLSLPFLSQKIELFFLTASLYFLILFWHASIYIYCNLYFEEKREGKIFQLNSVSSSFSEIAVVCSMSYNQIQPHKIHLSLIKKKVQFFGSRMVAIIP